MGHPMIVIGHSNKGNLKVVPLSTHPQKSRQAKSEDVTSIAASTGLRGKAYVGNLVVVHPSQVIGDTRKNRAANLADVEKLRKGESHSSNLGPGYGLMYELQRCSNIVERKFTND